MAKTVVTIKTEKTLKEKAQKIAKELGFPLGTLINAFLRQFVRNKTVYFTTINADAMTGEMEKQLDEIEKDIKKETNLSPSFSDMKEALVYLKKA